ncbi:transcriptional regulator, TetR family [Singulisphaera sp. GP187]|uniref:TetR/AcrR family transcriptional regulator n=1 Tax=Singulisphaera sp. GP187 TaxID=1882752 RepID=UPI00092A1D0D|nr:TetR/AcrR family transcriptional regulator [Singulisphaera sp. GP187]SIO60509.1 transcriptional regulator, TetR family [Singulisphaera sp. GP187]
MSDRDTRRELLDLAETLVRTRGYNGFSYRDLAEQIGIKTASIHYHFPTKGDLGEALIENEREVFAKNLAQLDAAEKDPRRRLERFIQLFQASTIGCDNRMCLGAMLAAEQETLPDAMGQAVRRLFAANEAWLAKLLEAGRNQRQFRFNGSADLAARSLFSALEGALLTARAFHDIGRFEATSRWILETLIA